ncbi:MAG TPA: LPXTG cell wall anchor domain-containing protein [Acidimicrobiales bacterium]|nr:LPXTG cell wall anchor domain-containing protein [Acidimicrobiales bacterium]
MVKRLIAAGAMALLAMAAPAAAQQYPPAVNSLTCSDTTPTPGQTISCQARTFAAGGAVTVTLNSDPVTLGTATADAAGLIALQVTIPTGTPLGAHTLVATGPAPTGQTLNLSLAITVVSARGGGAGSTGGNLPDTGSNSIPLAQIGLGLLAAGGVIYAIASRRRKGLAVSS